MKKTVYVGPTIPGVAIRNAVYEELPEALTKAIKARPYLGGLCVPIRKLPAAMEQIEVQQGGTYTLYRKALNDSADIQRDIQKGVN